MTFFWHWNNLMCEDCLVAYKAEKRSKHRLVFVLEELVRVSVAKRRAVLINDGSPVVRPRRTSELLRRFCDGVGLPFCPECVSDVHPKPSNQLEPLTNAAAMQADSLTHMVWDLQEGPRDFCYPLRTIHQVPRVYVVIFVQPGVMIPNRGFPGFPLSSNDGTFTDRDQILISDSLGHCFKPLSDAGVYLLRNDSTASLPP